MEIGSWGISRRYLLMTHILNQNTIQTRTLYSFDQAKRRDYCLGMLNSISLSPNEHQRLSGYFPLGCPIITQNSTDLKLKFIFLYHHNSTFPLSRMAVFDMPISQPETFFYFLSAYLNCTYSLRSNSNIPSSKRSFSNEFSLH